jgi:hypothetical protein
MAEDLLAVGGLVGVCTPAPPLPVRNRYAIAVSAAKSVTKLFSMKTIRRRWVASPEEIVFTENNCHARHCAVAGGVFGRNGWAPEVGFQLGWAHSSLAIVDGPRARR